MINSEKILKGFTTAEARWARFGPYYAMFPLKFAFDVVEKYTKPGDYIIDPFAGRGSSVYAGGVLGRHSLGIEINPVGWLYGKVKLKPASKEDVVNRLGEIYEKRIDYSDEIEEMSRFFRICYCDDVLKFLLSAQKLLDWENSSVDSTLIAIILIYLHAKKGEGLSNQMRMTKSMGMNYSINWWNKNNMEIPPEINPYELLLQKINWRYEKGLPSVTNSSIILGDCTIELEKILKNSSDQNIKYSLLFTSPPYWSITDYHLDQWLRLWLLGGLAMPRTQTDKNKKRFYGKQEYCQLLDHVFDICSKMMTDKNTIYVRTDKRDFTRKATIEVLEKHFPEHRMETSDRPLSKDTKTQTKLFGDQSIKPGEIDIILTK